MTIFDILTAALTSNYGLIYQWGYFGVFVISLVSNATLFFFPVPFQAVIFAAAAIFNPFWVAVAAAAGAIIGDAWVYMLGLGGKEILERKYEWQIMKTRRRFEKHGAFVWIFAAALFPFPIDVVSIFCGIIKYDFKKFIIALTLGKFIKYLVLAYAGAELFQFIGL